LDLFSHNNRKINGLNNNKLFILVKGNGEPIFKKDVKLTIITPSCRINNIVTIKNSINLAIIILSSSVFFNYSFRFFKNISYITVFSSFL
jgi:hypothetical protein